MNLQESSNEDLTKLEGSPSQSDEDLFSSADFATLKNKEYFPYLRRARGSRLGKNIRGKKKSE